MGNSLVIDWEASSLLASSIADYVDYRKESYQQSYPDVNSVSYINGYYGKTTPTDNSGMNVMGIANYFMIGFQASSTGRNTCLVL